MSNKGCLIIDLVDHRSMVGDEPTKERVILPLDAEALWNDIRSEHDRSGKVNSDEEALDLEARLLVRLSWVYSVSPF